MKYFEEIDMFITLIVVLQMGVYICQNSSNCILLKYAIYSMSYNLNKIVKNVKFLVTSEPSHLIKE